MNALRQLIVVVAPTALRGCFSALQAALGHATLGPLVHSGDAALQAFHTVEAPDADLDALAVRLRALPFVDGAYVKPADQLPVCILPPPRRRPGGDPSPDFTGRQGYLGPAPEGVDAAAAWAVPGGRGAGVHVVDIEGGWDFDHEDLQENTGGVIGGVPYPERYWRDHGTAVLGVIAGDANGFGVTGIAPETRVSAISHRGRGTAPAIFDAVEALTPGDMVLVEAHRPGPRFDFAPRPDQRGYIPVEWWPDDLAVIQYAARKGVIVIEAAGNGAEDLDDPLYDKPAEGFPRSWVNPLGRAVDTGSLFVGAGAPPPGTHGRTLYGPDRSRLEFSNYGSSVDAQGWGREVTTTGYGDLQERGEHRAYTDLFSGTSSASPVVVGALACVQGILRARGRAPLTALQARVLLRTSGSPQQDRRGVPAEETPIGLRPDLRQMLAALDARPIPVAPDDARTRLWLATDWTRGPVDLYGLTTGPTPSGRIELIVLDGGDGLRSLRGRFVTAIEAHAGRAMGWALAGNDTWMPDLHAIDLGLPHAAEATVRVLRAEDGYSTVREVRRVARAEAQAMAQRQAEGARGLVFWDDPDDDGEPSLYALQEGVFGWGVTAQR